MALPHPIIREAPLASPSPIINRLIEMLFDPSASINDLATTLSTDAALSARALGAANAALSYPKNRIDNVHDAVIRIGLIQIIHFITTAEIKAVFLSVPGKHGNMKALWTHNMITACIADAYAQHLQLEKPARWYTGGLLHDIGRLLLLVHDPVKYAEVVARVSSNEQSTCDAESEVYGISHQHLGHQLMTLWRFPEEIAEAAFHHQQPFVAYEEFRSGITIANGLANALYSATTLPKYKTFSATRVIADASIKYERLKMASGIAQY
jgi:putative nucleotidyltransferase with HDIG domain